MTGSRAARRPSEDSGPWSQALDGDSSSVRSSAEGTASRSDKRGGSKEQNKAREPTRAFVNGATKGNVHRMHVTRRLKPQPQLGGSEGAVVHLGLFVWMVGQVGNETGKEAEVLMRGGLPQGSWPREHWEGGSWGAAHRAHHAKAGWL